MVIASISCSNTKAIQGKDNKTNVNHQYVSNGNQNTSCVRGILKDIDNEPIIGATVKLMKDDEFIAGAASDLDGKFNICHDVNGECVIQISYVGYRTQTVAITLKPGETLILDQELELFEEEVILLKPIIYLYPESTHEIEVKMPLEKGFSHSYPKYTGSWKVTADDNGNLFDSTTMRSYYGLYWEAAGNFEFTLDEGNVVSGENTVEFLEAALDTLGLSEREANEFIVFWLPILEANPYNLIHFSSTEYESMAPLEISPKPDTEIRVMMVYQALQQEIQFPKQDLSILAKNRHGFTVVEWGGSKYTGTISLSEQ